MIALRTRGLDGVVGVVARVVPGAVRVEEGWGMRDMGCAKEELVGCEYVQVQESVGRVT